MMPVSGFTEFKQAVQHLCLIFEASETSGFRTAKRNAKVGGVTNSRHLTGLAVDLVLDDPGRHGELMEACEAMGLRAINEGDHIHIQVVTP